jgi:drug/metabolite transporter (DMT)-like permease
VRETAPAAPSAGLTRPRRPRRALVIAALLGGATAIATSALWVKVSETGPVATGFWRVFLALPALWMWGALTSGVSLRQDFRTERRSLVGAGLFFAGDLGVWHWSIMLTSIANSTLLANLAPIFVTLAAWLFLRRKPSALFLIGLGTALTGVAALIGGDFSLSGTATAGDLLGVVTAVFYAGYQLTVTAARSRVSTASIMAWSSMVTAAALLPIAVLSGERLFPATSGGWIILVGLALTSQVAGQSLIAYAMAHLPATFSSVALLFQPVMTAVMAWIILGEAMGAGQILACATVLLGIGIAHNAELVRSSARRL